MNKFKVGDKVKFVNETPAESKFTMIVREVNGDRTLVETVIPGFVYNSTSTYPTKSLIKK